MLVKTQLRLLVVQRIVIIALTIALLVTVIRIWKFEGKGASEWYTEYTALKWEYEKLVGCLYQFDADLFYKRQDGVVRYCRI